MKAQKTPYKNILTIAGSDSGGCAGIQADIKSISACGAYAASVITATTAQNTKGVIDIHTIPNLHIEKQLDAVFSDIHFDAIKIGMLHSCDVITIVSEKLTKYNPKNIVIDPVMVASSGDMLITEAAIDCLKKLLPKALLITPNKKEAELILDYTIDYKNMKDATKEIGQKTKSSVLLKVGALETLSSNMYHVFYEYSTNKISVLEYKQIMSHNIHGSGCSLSSSIATFIGKGYSLEEAVKKGCTYVHQAIEKGENKVLGKGNGPINHFGLES
jgi:hydroxymethylpyrimidine/phosphomethylpyrimidine kinase